MFLGAPPFYYDMILMDVHMPNMDGYEATEAIRASDRPDAQSISIVALTANAFKEDIDTAIRRGMNAHVAKPVEMDALIKMMSFYLK
jgi:CheY-like chemotaxis protein